jgi:hypothetical protein
LLACSLRLARTAYVHHIFGDFSAKHTVWVYTDIHHEGIYGVYIGLARTVHGIPIYCMYAVYDRIYAVFPYTVRSRSVRDHTFK